MLDFLLYNGVVDRVAQKSAHMTEVDPYGLTLTLVSVSVVFGALILLYCAYAILGEIFIHKQNKKSHAHLSAEESAAIALALSLSMEDGSDEQVAALAAVSLYLKDNQVHDVESGVITIKR